MKKHIIILIFTITGQIVYCQRKHQLFGIRIAPTIANFSNNTLPNRYHYRGLSYDLGITSQILHPNKIGFNVEAAYSRRNVKNNRFGYALHYLSWSSMANYYFGHTQTSVYAGGYIAILISSRVINDYPKSGESFKKLDSGLIFGMSQKIIETTRLNISLDARYNHGFIAIKENELEAKTRNYSYGLGLIFSLK